MPSSWSRRRSRSSGRTSPKTSTNSRPPSGRAGALAASGPGPAELRRIALAALAEDRWDRDITSRAVVGSDVRAVGRIQAQATGVLAGIPIAVAVARSAGLRIRKHGTDGDRVLPGSSVLELDGPAWALLAAERTVLNFLMHLSGVATATASAVRELRGSEMELRATRKTLPGLRDLEKAAVVAGGGQPHRRDLSEALLLKNNHLALAPLGEAVARAHARARGRIVEVEVSTLAQAVAAAGAGASELLIDNATPATAGRIVRGLAEAGLRERVRIELSGGLTVRNLHRYRAVGADAVSLGSLTHSAPALPFHLTVRRARR